MNASMAERGLHSSFQFSVLVLCIFCVGCGYGTLLGFQESKPFPPEYDKLVPYGAILSYHQGELIVSTDFLPPESAQQWHYAYDAKSGRATRDLPHFIPAPKRRQTECSEILARHYKIERCPRAEYGGYSLSTEHWKSRVRGFGANEKRLVLRRGSVTRNYLLEFGLSDFLIEGDDLYILSEGSESQEARGRHLTRYSLQKMIKAD